MEEKGRENVKKGETVEWRCEGQIGGGEGDGEKKNKQLMRLGGLEVWVAKLNSPDPDRIVRFLLRLKGSEMSAEGVSVGRKKFQLIV